MCLIIVSFWTAMPRSKLGISKHLEEPTQGRVQMLEISNGKRRGKRHSHEVFFGSSGYSSMLWTTPIARKLRRTYRRQSIMLALGLLLSLVCFTYRKILYQRDQWCAYVIRR